jgi:flavin-dependent thymidylate synthase
MHMAGEFEAGICARQAMEHADTGSYPHGGRKADKPYSLVKQADGKPEEGLTLEQIAAIPMSALVQKADAAQYARPPMPDAARKGPTVTLIDAPVDPLGTLAVIGGIYTGQVARSKTEVTDEQRRAMLADMQKTVLDGPLECVQFTFLVEGVGRDFTHQAVRNRFSFFAQESLRFAVAEDWAQEVPLPPSLASLPQDAPAVGVWRKALNAAEDSYAALIGAGMPAEEARKVLPHAITTRYYWVVSLRTLLQEAGKRTCTQAQFDWRVVMAGVAKALRERGLDGALGVHAIGDPETGWDAVGHDGWQYDALSDLIRPVCYQTGSCGFMAKFDRGCTIRKKVDVFAINNIPSSQWHDKKRHGPMAIDPREWAADPAAARTYEEGS